MIKRTLKKDRLVRFGLALAALAFIGCSSPEKQSKQAIVKVNDRTVTLGQYQSALKRLLPSGRGAAKEQETLELKRDLINQLIEEELLIGEAEKTGLSVSEAELSAEVDGLKKEYGDQDFKDAVTERYGSLENWKEEIKRKLLIKKIVDKVTDKKGPTEQQAKKYYQTHIKEFEADEQAKARMIVVSSEEQAKKLRATLTPANFAEVARQNSLSPDARNGGDLGYFGRGDMPQEFEDVVFMLKPNAISPVIKTDYGYHIFLLEAYRKGGRLKFNEVKSKIMEKLRLDEKDKALNNWITSQKERAVIEVREELL